MRFRTCLLLALASISPALRGEPWPVVPWPAAVPPTIDGQLDETAWQNIPAQTGFLESRPGSGAPPYPTLVRLSQDAEFLYIGIQLHDPPGERLSNVARRDHVAATDDTVTVTLDSLGTRTVGQMLSVNPDCAINDGLYKEASLSTDLSVDFSYTVACAVQDHSWSVEWRIPWRELRFVDGASSAWNILVQRNFVRGQAYALANAPAPADPLCWLCLAPVMEGVKPSPVKPYLRLTPYAMGRTETIVPGSTERKLRLGADGKWRLDAATIIDATVNPDFSQVSLDEPQLLANAQFAVSYPENRPFFLEGADILETPLKVVATRSIHQPSWGLKYTQRSAEQDTMVLIGDDGTMNSLILPGPYRSRTRALHAKQRFAIASTHLKDSAYNLGLTLTARSYDELGSNQTLSLDGMHYFSREYTARWQSILALSDNRWDGDLGGFARGKREQGAAQYLLLQHKSEVWQSSVELKSFTDDLRTDLGFNPRNAYRLAILTQTLRQSFANQHIDYGLRWSEKDELNGRLIQNQWAPSISFSGFLGMDASWEARPLTRERIRTEGVLHRYQQQVIEVSAYPGSVLTNFACDITWGERIDVAGDRVRPGRADGCSGRVALGKRIEWTSRASEEVLPAVLVNRALSQLLVMPLSSRWSLRYIRQDARIERSGNPPSRTATDSWSLAYESAESLALHAGATVVQNPDENIRRHEEFYVKVQATLP